MLRETQTENGRIRGITAADTRITAFKGVPYAAPPIGAKRWREPQPCDDWDGIYLAQDFAPISVQDTPGIGDIIYNREWHVDPQIPMDEDCLYLNIWTNSKDATEKMPVIIFFFGGALQWGYTSEMELDGERFARRDVVFVSINYRINVFGFLAHPELTKEQPSAPTNFGNLDQLAGIRWVIRNIANFGGDPNNITIGGQSAGGGSVLSHLASPQTNGLFQKAIVHSATIRTPYPGDQIGIPEDMESAEQNGVDFFHFLGVKSLDEARKLDAFLIRDKYGEYAQSHPRMMTVVDGIYCVGDPLVLCLQGKCPDIPLMVGNTKDEFPSMILADNEEEFLAKAQDIFKEQTDTFLSFAESRVHAKPNIYAPISGLEITAKYLLSRLKNNGFSSDVYYYCFDSDIPGEDCPGTFHSVDLWFFFETLAKCSRPFCGRHYDLSRMMCNYLCNFIKTGNPNGSDADQTPMPQWNPYVRDTPGSILFTAPNPISVNASESDFTQFLMKKIASDLKV